ncbi:hypothetical protein WEN_01570 [Mycoplasma wenyonii str. Massachusetts]|uniref:Uncharacterized protein n=1 Tax=Mycoplasma wenyonii (strain Massachusetts) TaxID=1197325 RepID=I6YLD6_MYCWM|nr:hypothetical protein [Mycoplasma wenyonii]AFN65109.1 hypothetical protein WEN_01570 [Mycoplasma wenyonii str. Massachusetts]
MSVGILALKVGVVATVTGVSVATPILLKRSSGVSSEPVTSNVVSDTGSEREGAGVQRVQATEETLSRSSSLTGETSNPSVVVTESFDKKCFIIPARSSDGVELLTCYEDKKIREDADSNEEEYDSIFHIYDKSKPSNPVEIDKSLLWNPTAKQLTASLTQKSDYSSEYTFTATGDEWGGISNDSINLLTPRECAVFQVGSDTSKYVLTCGNDSSADETKGIPLTAWQKGFSK